MNGTNPTRFFDPKAAFRELVEGLRPLNGTGHYPLPDWKRVLAQVEAADQRRYVEACNGQIPSHAVVLVDFRLIGTRPKLVVLGTGFQLVADQTRNRIAVRAYHLRDEARIRRNNLAAARRYQEPNREKINAARRAKRAAAKSNRSGDSERIRVTVSRIAYIHEPEAFSTYRHR
jgi:hypothetical protein